MGRGGGRASVNLLATSDLMGKAEQAARAGAHQKKAAPGWERETRRGGRGKHKSCLAWFHQF
jgi:hypothetical protein